MAGPDGGLVRGTLWRNFLVRYPESNRMHKKMLALSALHRALAPGRGSRKVDLVAARRAIGRAQCNDAYWHGVFGGLYLPHLRRRCGAISRSPSRRCGAATSWKSSWWTSTTTASMRSGCTPALLGRDRAGAGRRRRGVHRLRDADQLR